MSVPTTSFLAGLAPVNLAGDTAHYVRAARPARFAIMAADAVGEMLPPADAPDPQGSAADPEAGRVRPPVRDEHQRPSRSAPPADEQRSTARTVTSDAAALVAPPAQPPLTLMRAEAAPRGKGRTRSAQPRPDRARATTKHAPPADISTRPVAPVVPQAPLREGVQSARWAAEPPPATPVVHVTIDRIDVRAPANPPSAAPQKTRRAASPSLREYLRRGDSTGGSGAQ